jgi:predicted permease
MAQRGHVWDSVRVSGDAFAAIIFWAVLLLVPVAVGVFAYRLGRMWPAQVSGLVLLAYSIALPFLIAHVLASYDQFDDHRQAAGFMVGLAWMWLAAICIAATVGGIFGDDRAPMESDRLHDARG